MVLAVGAFTQIFIDRFERSHLDYRVNDMLTLNRVITQYNIDNNGDWPGESAGSCDYASFVSELGDYLPGFAFYDPASDPLYAIDCDAQYRFELSALAFRDDDAADYVANQLPLASTISNAQADDVLMIVPRPRTGNTAISFATRNLDNTGSANFPKPEGCSSPRISVTVNRICVPGQDALGGYHLHIDPSDSDQWEVSLQVVEDGSSSYQSVYQCGSNPIAVDAIILCLD